MAGIIGIYGLVVSVLISDGLAQTDYSLFTGFIQLGAGLAVGLAGMAAGFAIGIVGDAGVRGTAQQPRLFVGMILILIFAEVLGELFLEAPSAMLLDPGLAPMSCFMLISNCNRSVRVDCRAAHELQGLDQRQLLSALPPTHLRLPIRTRGSELVLPQCTRSIPDFHLRASGAVVGHTQVTGIVWRTGEVLSLNRKQLYLIESLWSGRGNVATGDSEKKTKDGWSERITPGRTFMYHLSH